MRKVIVAKMSSLNGYYEGAGRNVTITTGKDFSRSWPNQVEVTLQGIPYVQEDSPAEIGMALREFITAPSKGGDARLTSARLD